jgi:hypothetical protein
LISRAFHPQSTEVEICIQIPPPDTAATAVEPPPIYAVTRDELDVPYVVRARIVKP